MLNSLRKALFVMILGGGCFLHPLPGVAADFPVADIVQTLRRMDATVIVRPNGILLLNKGSLNGIQRGDLWRIYGPGELIKDPVSGKDLGRMSETAGIARVVRTEEQFCEIELIQPKKAAPRMGHQALRFDGITAVLQDGSGTGYDLYETLRVRLPALRWAGYEKTDAAKPVTASPDTLIFSIRNERLTLWSGGEILNIYGGAPVSGQSSAPAEMVTPATVTAPLPDPAPTLPPSEPAESIKPAAQPVPGLMTPGMSAHLITRQYRSVGSLNHIVLQLDVMPMGESGKPCFVYLSDDGLFVQSVLGQGSPYVYRYNGFGRVAGISVGRDGMIALNVFNQRDWEMTSLLLRFSGDRFEVIAKDINYILAYVDVNDDGTMDLVGQTFDRESFFGPEVNTLELQDGQVNPVKAVNVPFGFRIYGAFWADLDGNHTVENGFYNAARRLRLFAGGEETWQSTDPFGGSIQGVSIKNIESEGATSRNEIIWSPAAVVPYDKGKFVALARNDPSLLNIVGVRPRKGEVGILYKNNGQHFLRVLDAGFEGPVQSVFTWKDELYCAIVEGSLFTGKGKTHVIAFSLAELKKALH
jgi:hypothetical protein